MNPVAKEASDILTRDLSAGGEWRYLINHLIGEVERLDRKLTQRGAHTIPPGYALHHINGDSRDNTLANLRMVKLDGE